MFVSGNNIAKLFTKEKMVPKESNTAHRNAISTLKTLSDSEQNDDQTQENKHPTDNDF